MLEMFITPPPLDILLYIMLGLLAMTEGPFATLAGGVATSNGLLLPVPAYLSVVVGNLTADMGWYALGRFSKPEWLTRFVQKRGVDTRRIDRLAREIRLHAPRLLFFSKLTVGFPIPTLVATGLSRVPIRRWVGMLILGELIKSAVLVSIGYLYARAVMQASHGVQVVLWIITAGIITAGLIWYKRRKSHPSN
jgi:membrane protein DedA with SNARE-associated domain